MGDLEVGDAAENLVGKLGVQRKVHEHALKAAHVPGALIDVAVRRHEAVVGLVTRGGDALGHDRVVEPVGGRPGVGGDVVRGLRLAERVVGDLVVAARAVADRLPPDAPHVPAGLQGRTDVLRPDALDVDERAEVLGDGRAAVLGQVGFELRVRRRVDARADHGNRHAVSRLVVEGQGYALAMGEFRCRRAHLAVSSSNRTAASAMASPMPGA